MELEKNNKKETKKINIPEGSAEFVENLLEKFDLKEEQEKGIEKLFQVSDVKEREKIFEQLPGRKIALLIRKYAFGEIDLKEIPGYLKKELNLPSLKAKEMTEELKKLFFLIPQEKGEEEKEETKEEAKEEKSESSSPSIQKYQPDIYREPIEE